MSTSDGTHSGADITNDNLCSVLESILEGNARTQILDRALTGDDFEAGVNAFVLQCRPTFSGLLGTFFLSRK